MISFTLASLIWLPLAAVSLFVGDRYRLILLLLAAAMPDAAVLLLPFFGLQTGYWMALVVTGLAVVNARATPPYLFRVSVLFFAFIVASLIAFAYGSLFPQPDVLVLSGRVGMSIAKAEPFTPRIENINQYSYLVFNFLLVVFFSSWLSGRDPNALKKDIHLSIDISFVFIFVVCIIQQLSYYTGFGFSLFNDLFHSNLFYGEAHLQGWVSAGMIRVSGSYLEPSHLGYALSGYLFFFIARLQQLRRHIDFTLVTACILLMLLSTATTAYIGVIFALAFFVGRALLWGRLIGALQQVQYQAWAWAALLLIALAGAVASVYWSFVRESLDYTLLNKAGTESFELRSNVELLGYDIFVKTYGIGLGVGSHRANSFLGTLVSNTGLLGTIAALSLMAFAAFVPASSTAHGRERERFLVAPVQAFFLGFAALALVSNPNLSDQLLWLSLCLLAGLRAAIRREELQELKRARAPASGLRGAAPLRGVPRPEYTEEA